jgi:hypothetical protein
MIAMGRADESAVRQSFEDAGTGRLLTDIDMVVADEVPCVVQADDGLLEVANHEHALEDRQAGFLVEWRHRCPGRHSDGCWFPPPRPPVT